MAISATGLKSVRSRQAEATVTRPMLQLSGLVVMFLLEFAFRTTLTALELRELAIVCVLVVTIVMLLTNKVSSQGFWSISSVYLFVFSLFHFGLAFVIAIGQLSQSTESFLRLGSWLYNQPTNDALVLSLLGATSCSLGSTLVHVYCQRSPKSQLSHHELALGRGAYLAVLGGPLVIFFIILWVTLVILSGGVGLFTQSYQDYLATTSSSGYSSYFSFVWFGIGTGLCFLAASKPSGWHKAAVAVLLLIFAPLALPLGLRGEILFPVLAALAIRAKRGVRPPMLLTVVAILIGLFAISLVKDVRQVGLANASDSQSSGSVWAALAELGGGLHPVAEVVFWRQTGDEFIHGASYWAPIDRAIARIVPGGTTVPAQDDERIMNVLVQHRVGPIGFSPVAEAYRNFGELGVIIVMCLIGVIVGLLDQLSPSPYRLAIAGIVLIELLINVRNSFVPVPAHLFLGAILLMVSIVLERFWATQAKLSTMRWTA